MRPEWDEYFLGICTAVSARADCTRRQVGSVIVDSDHRVISIGYNGAVPGEPGCLTTGGCPRGKLSVDQQPRGGSYSNCVAVHSEANALLYSDPVRRKGGTLYCTDEPCSDCLKLIKGSGIARIVTPFSTHLL